MTILHHTGIWSYLSSQILVWTVKTNQIWLLMIPQVPTFYWFTIVSQSVGVYVLIYLFVYKALQVGDEWLLIRQLNTSCLYSWNQTRRIKSGTERRENITVCQTVKAGMWVGRHPPVLGWLMFSKFLPFSSHLACLHSDTSVYFAAFKNYKWRALKPVRGVQIKRWERWSPRVEADRKLVEWDAKQEWIRLSLISYSVHSSRSSRNRSRDGTSRLSMQRCWYHL